ncbi:unnamed protein product [Ostreobium quekettii]|uniref:SUMO-activating enzyme subunit n=1 Tax=Ostreobium quekettii TaxID=121088 RepID=A0A8S1IUN1_9CHLO|nr:unnamed protein product [Ostreobium quekettii]|eukprot:evm.model.scf_828EXC.7 EVM.evm.TU.scf_828EXC.7   scf_828EXC:38794-45189(+)
MWPEVTADPAFKDKVSSARVLAVGAGGIGCELLKTLVLTGFKNIELIDLDTIETSNLNRQFLFRKRHVGQSKAQVAAEAVLQFKPDVKITAHQANIKELKFGVDYFKGFDVILNGLDNLDARRHVNRLCLAAGVPLIESGTAGYLGQVNVHVKDLSRCFECDEHAAPKTFPICTIRNTPEKPIHCVVWAKDLLFPRLFGRQDAVTDLDEQRKEVNGSSSSQADGAVQGPSFFLQKQGENSYDYAKRIFRRVYEQDIEQVKTMDELWKTRRPPQQLDLKEILDQQTLPETANGYSSASRALGLTESHKAWDLCENARVFLASIARYVDTRPDEIGTLVFDKDDDLAVDFITAASNLRALAYGIPTQSHFDAKGMAGNIVHAIATTNAITSGLIVTEALKILANDLDSCRETYLTEYAERKHVVMLNPSRPSQPKPDCMVCGCSMLSLKINTTTATLATFVDKVLKSRLSFNMPTIMCGDFLYEEGDGLEDDELEMYSSWLPKTLSALPGGGIGNGAIVDVQDQSQHFSVKIVVSHQDNFDEEKHPDGVILEGSAKSTRQAHHASSSANPVAELSNGAQSCPDDNEVVIVGSKGITGFKRARCDEGDDDDVVILGEPPARVGTTPNGKRTRL